VGIVFVSVCFTGLYGDTMKRNLHDKSEAIRKMINSGMQYKEIAYELKVNEYALKSHILDYFDVVKVATYKAKTRTSQIKETDKNEILAMHKDGITCGVIAKTFNVTYSAIYSFIKKNKGEA
jgi:DNA invertase Pin-like site-specific DNA recombinase